MAFIVIACGVALAAFGLGIRSTAPELSRYSFPVGTAGGGFCILSGILALFGRQRRGWTIAVLGAVIFFVLSETIQGWLNYFGKRGVVTAPVMLSIMLLLAIGTLMYLVHGERPPEFYKSSAIKEGGEGKERHK